MGRIGSWSIPWFVQGRTSGMGGGAGCGARVQLLCPSPSLPAGSAADPSAYRTVQRAVLPTAGAVEDGDVAERPYTVLSCAMSIDGYIAGAAMKPLPLSNAADFDRVDAVRASMRRHPGRRRYRPQRSTAAPGPFRRATQRAGGPRPAAVTDQGHRHAGGGQLDASASVLRGRRHREGGLLR